MEREQRISYLRSLLASPIWTEIIYPDYESRFMSLCKQAIIGRRTLPEAELRGLLEAAAEADTILNRYKNEIQDFDLTEREKAVVREQEEREAQEGEMQAKLGFRSPYVGPAPAITSPVVDEEGYE